MGGVVDPGSEAHDMVMTSFGGMSKGERTCIQLRAKASMFDLAQRSDRFLGGRPPHGYQLAYVGPHANPGKAAAGQRAHRLVPDPTTAPVVAGIFDMFVREGASLRPIPERLTGADIVLGRVSTLGVGDAAGLPRGDAPARTARTIPSSPIPRRDRILFCPAIARGQPGVATAPRRQRAAGAVGVRRPTQQRSADREAS